MPTIAAWIAAFVSGVAMIAPMAHLYELPHKIGFSADQYLIVQRIYQGWWIAGLALPIALLANLALAAAARHDRPAFGLALAAAGLIAINRRSSLAGRSR
jgi:hypothetical protein